MFEQTKERYGTIRYGRRSDDGYMNCLCFESFNIYVQLILMADTRRFMMRTDIGQPRKSHHIDSFFHFKSFYNHHKTMIRFIEKIQSIYYFKFICDFTVIANL